MHGARLVERKGRSVDQRERPSRKAVAEQQQRLLLGMCRTPNGERTKTEAYKIGGNILD
jgi:hypothetical protein